MSSSANTHDLRWALSLLEDFERFLGSQKNVPPAEIDEKRALMRRYLLSLIDLKESTSEESADEEKSPPVATYMRNDFFVAVPRYNPKSKKPRPNLLSYFSDYLETIEGPDNSHETALLDALKKRVAEDKKRHHMKKMAFAPMAALSEEKELEEKPEEPQKGEEANKESGFTPMNYSAQIGTAPQHNWSSWPHQLSATSVSASEKENAPTSQAEVKEEEPAKDDIKNSATEAKPESEPAAESGPAAPKLELDAKSSPEAEPEKEPKKEEKPASQSEGSAPPPGIKKAKASKAGSPLITPSRRPLMSRFMDGVYGNISSITAAGTAHVGMTLLMSGVSRTAICAGASALGVSAFAVPIIAAVGTSLAVKVYRNRHSVGEAWSANTGWWNKTRAASAEMFRGYTWTQLFVATTAGALMPLATDYACDALSDFEQAAHDAGVEEGVAQIQPDLDAAQDQIDNLTEQNEALAEEKEALTQENSELSEEVTELREENADLLEQLEEFRDRYDITDTPPEQLPGEVPEDIPAAPETPVVITDWSYQTHDVGRGGSLSQIALETWGADKMEEGIELLAYVNGMEGVEANWIRLGQDIIVPTGIDPTSVVVPDLDMNALNDNWRAGNVDFAQPRAAGAPLPPLTLKAA